MDIGSWCATLNDDETLHSLARVINDVDCMVIGVVRGEIFDRK